MLSTGSRRVTQSSSHTLEPTNFPGEILWIGEDGFSDLHLFREVYVPHIWRHMYSLFDGKGKKKVTIKKTYLSMFVWIFQEGTPIMVDIAGPLCFQGDYQVSWYNHIPWLELLIIASLFLRPRMWNCLPLRMGTFWPSMTPGPTQCPCTASEWVIDLFYPLFCCFFLFVRFNSIRASPVYGYRKVGDDIQFTCFKLRESVEECLQFWGLEKENIIQVWFVFNKRKYI